MINTYNLFAANVYHCKLPIQITLHKKIISFVENKYKEENNVSCVKGFQFHQDFEGKEELLKDLNIYLNNNFKKKIIHGWLNVLSNASYNKPHSHLGNSISHSGVFSNILLHYVLPEERIEKRICFAFNLESVK